jgi:Mrp family chromosome partitioning ATPase
VVIYDTPAALESADAYVVASRVGAAIVAARQHRTKARDIIKISRALEGFQCDIAGTILSRF